jgi:hypothetical protein
MADQGSTRSLLSCTLKTASILGCGCVPVMVKHVTAVLVHLAACAPDEEKESICWIRVPDEPIAFEIGSGPHFVDESRPKRHILLVLELDEDDSGVSGLVPHPGGSKNGMLSKYGRLCLSLGCPKMACCPNMAGFACPWAGRGAWYLGCTDNFEVYSRQQSSLGLRV